MTALLWTWEKNTGKGVGTQRRKPASNREKKSISEEATYCTRYSSTQSGFVLWKKKKKKRHEEGKSITGKYYRKSALAEVNRLYERVRPSTGVRGIKLLQVRAPAHKSSASSCMRISLTETLNLLPLPHPPYSPDLASCGFVFGFHHTLKIGCVLPGEDLTQDHPSDQPFSSLSRLQNRVQTDISVAGTQTWGWGWGWGGGCGWRVLWKVAVKDRRLRWREYIYIT